MPDLSVLPAEMVAALWHATAVVTVGAHPDHDARQYGYLTSWVTDDVPGGALPPKFIAAKLREAADAIEQGAL